MMFTMSRPQRLLSLLATTSMLLLLLQTTDAKNIYGISDYGHRTVSERLQSLGRAVDVNSDAEITGKELAQYARSLQPASYDADKGEKDDNENCVTPDEWAVGLQKAGFTEELAKEYKAILEDQPGWDTADCKGALDSDKLEAAAAKKPAPGGGAGGSGGTASKISYPLSLEEFLDTFLTKLTKFCEPGTAGSDLYTSNPDCNTLPTACASEPFGCGHTCRQYTFVTTAGRTDGAFSTRALQHATASASGIAPDGFAAKLEATFDDADGDGVFSKKEQAQDWSENFDSSRDGCVSKPEFLARMATAICKGIDFSEKFALARFDALKDDTTPCKGIDTSIGKLEDMTQAGYMEKNTAALIKLCEDPVKRDDVQECKELSIVCEVEKLTSSTPSCLAYVAKSRTKTGLPVENTAVKFYNFLKKWGTFEDYFGKSG